MNEKYILTKKGFDDLNQELENLKTVDRPAVVNRLKEAREMGLLDDNPEYDAAREELGRIEARIAESEEILSKAEIANQVSNASQVRVGSTVLVEFDGAEDEFTIVGITEADPSAGRISHDSPAGKALLGAKVGENVHVTTSSQTKVNYKVKKIS